MKNHYIVLAVAAVALVCNACSAESDYAGESFSQTDGTYAPPQSGDKYDKFTDNPFVKTADQPVSTFSVDADGASYGIMRRFVTGRLLPDPSAVRIEEFLNYFTFDYLEPTDDNAVAVNYELGTCPWNRAHRLLRLGLKGKSIEQDRLPASNYVFLIDVSGSMNTSDKLELLKAGLTMLVDNLRPNDRVSIITYSGTVQKLLESTLVSDAATIKTAVSRLVASGSTAGGAALEMAYREAAENYIEGGNNRIVLGTDGDFNVGVTSTEALVEMVETNAKKGIYITVCGFGLGNLNDSMMEKISNAGNGTYEYIDSEDELTKVFANEVSKMYAVANDVKLQLTFNPATVESYRLIGYENRVLSEEDFDNDLKDAGEIGAGQTITALYEIVPNPDSTGKYADFDVRYKRVLGESSVELNSGIYETDAAVMPSREFDFAASLAAFGMVLRDSPYKGDATIDMAFELSAECLNYDPFGYRKQYRELLQQARTLSRSASQR